MTFPNPPCPRCGNLAKLHDEQRRCVACLTVWRPLLLQAAQESGDHRPAVHQCYGCHYTWTADSEILRLLIDPLAQPSRCSTCGHWWELGRVVHMCPGQRGALDARASDEVRRPAEYRVSAAPTATQREFSAKAGREILKLLGGATKTVLDVAAEELGQPRTRSRRKGG